MIRNARPSFGACAGVLALGLLATACSSPEPFARSTGQPGFTGHALDSEPLASRIDRGSWMVSTQSKLWKVFEDQRDAPDRHVGFLIGSQYRQMRGGPKFRLFKVTTLDRNDQIGHIDHMGKAVRYEPRRHGDFSEVPVGSSSREENVAAIFDTGRPIRLEETSEERLAFEALDEDGNGLLSREETANWGGGIANADKNRDGFVDFAEFQEMERL